jgi:acyl-CoA dehydrogenase
MTEPGAGSDLQAVRTWAVRDRDHYVVNGAKTFITNGYTGNLLAVVVKTDPRLGAKGISLIAMETEGLAGFRVGRVLEKIGNAASDTCELFFDDVRVPAENLIGGVEGQGLAQLMSQLPFERMLIAVTATAVIERALELTVAYTKDRKAFGQSVFDFQNTRFRLDECATLAHVVRTFVNDCIQRLLRGCLEAEAAYMAKWWCTEQQCRVLDECLQLFGGYGCMSEFPIARMHADARVQKIYGGANEVMKELIGRSL